MAKLNSIYCFTLFVAGVTVVELLRRFGIVLAIITTRTVVTSTITTTTLKPCITNAAASTATISNPIASILI